MYAQIFVPFDKNIKKDIRSGIDGYVIPGKISYGFTIDKNPDNNTLWYNLRGEPGNEKGKVICRRAKNGSCPALIFDGFNMEIDLEAGFEKSLYKISYCYKYKDSLEYDINNFVDKEEIYIYETPDRNFWEAVMY